MSAEAAAAPTLGELARDDGPAFAAPWEATAFALRAHLLDRGLVDPARFAELYGEELRRGHAQPEDGTADYVAFVRALERAIAAVAPEADLVAEQQRWRDAAASTPHGTPIALPDR
ncbi:nitrile hydratase accessory protein [Acuticoccus sp. I52.16.1]|uniref:nitrile hydratase accessory protein n=1 Tax=Acuticoccus sp. I52.16.1 TaxID=2928472 RepID=UPI001FD2523C|nr:nitrile hydratase accessory protein [Acuticoccus sp. I52.16.1]UOM36281.1 nitrile hydratase accessory protein [Acuticoccus sp. I52.16.1]